ncbi:hypothetical protein Tco_0992994 [Tanacetum coccineum]|uniref:Uncharacterized protein n=1 Tax=Tanacetum coccineum TaxID=301880 RepID=A0ABQ5F3X0_9ASTR
MKDVFEQNDVYLDKIERQNNLLKEQLLEASLKHDIELCVLLNHECVDKSLHDELEQVKKKSLEIQEGLKARIKILEKDVQRCEKQKNEHLKLVYKNLFDLIKKTRVQKENLRATLSEFSVNQHLNSPSSTNELKKESGENICDNAKCEFQTKFVELEKVLTQQTKDFDDVKLEFSNRTTKFEAYFEKHEKIKVVLERQLARKVDDSKAEKDRFLKEINQTQLENLKGKRVETNLDNYSILGKPRYLTMKEISFRNKLASQDIRSCQKEYHELRTSYNALKVKFDSLNRKKWNINVTKYSKPKESVSEKVHTGDSLKPIFKMGFSIYNIFFTKR